jgi:hypothetical protein
MKILFTIQHHSIIDVITNSSSELFVGNSDSKEKMESLIKEVYPDYLNEYEELKTIDDFTIDELDSHMNWITGSYVWPAKKENYRIPNGFTFEELYEAKSKKTAWNGEIQYRLKNNKQRIKNKWDSAFVTKENFEEIKNKLDPNRTMFFLFSLDDNPNWEMQKQLSSIMNRYHLG